MGGSGLVAAGKCGHGSHGSAVVGVATLFWCLLAFRPVRGAFDSCHLGQGRYDDHQMSVDPFVKPTIHTLKRPTRTSLQPRGRHGSTPSSKCNPVLWLYWLVCQPKKIFMHGMIGKGACGEYRCHKASPRTDAAQRQPPSPIGISRLVW